MRRTRGIMGHVENGKKTAEYRAWLKIKERCYCPTCKEYKWYGAKGVVMCDKWLSDFNAFLQDVGPKPSVVGSKYSIDRYPNTRGNYEPGNVRWATIEQQLYNKTNTLRVVVDGIQMLLKDACVIYGVNYKTIIVYHSTTKKPHQEIFDELLKKEKDARPNRNANR